MYRKILVPRTDEFVDGTMRRLDTGASVNFGRLWACPESLTPCTSPTAFSFRLNLRAKSALPCHHETQLRCSPRAACGDFVALGRVSYITTESGMSIAFTQIEPNDHLILEKWVEELRDH